MPMPFHGNPLDADPADFGKQLQRRSRNRAALIKWVKDNLHAGIDFMSVHTKRGWSKPFLTKAGSEKILGMLGCTPTFPNLNDWMERIRDDADAVKIIALRCDILNAEGRIVATGAGARDVRGDYGDFNKTLKMVEKSAQIDATLRLGGLSEVFSQDPESMTEELDEIKMPISAEQAADIEALCSEYGLPVGPVAEFFNVDSIEKLPKEYFRRAIKAIHKAGKARTEQRESTNVAENRSGPDNATS